MHRPSLLAALVLALLAAPPALADGAPPDGAAPGTPAPATPGAGKPAIGTRVTADLALTDVRHLRRRLDDLGERRATVLVAVTTTCPICKRYVPRLVELEAAYRARGVRFALLAVGRGTLPLDVAAATLAQGVPFPALLDLEGAAVRALGLERTPEAVVLDAEGRIAYRGRIDDQHRIGGSRPAPSREDLREALDDVLAGAAVRVAEAPAEGCRISLDDPTAAPAAGPAPTWADVAPIFERRCVRCHHEGGGAPFSLVDYEDAWALADQVADVTGTGRMPPWFASGPGVTFADDPRLSADERRSVSRWVEAGAPLGDPRTAPVIEAPPPADGWRLGGPPDLVIRSIAPERLPATGEVPYRYDLLPYTFAEDTWVSGIEIRPTNPKVMHHCNLAYLPDGDPDHPQFLCGQVPGGECMHLDPGLGVLLPRGATLVLQIHYVTTGVPETCTLEVGLRWPRDPIKKSVRHLVMEERDLAIPPGERFHEVRAARPLPCDATGLALFTHMHLRGRDATFLAHRPDGTTETLLSVPAYDFNWQLSYLLKPGTLRLPAGTRLECVGHFDNSAWNPFNPDPTLIVGNGPQTRQEMFFGFFFYTDDAEALDVHVDPATGHALPAPAPLRR